MAFAIGFAIVLWVWTEGIDQLPFRATDGSEWFELGDRLLTLSGLALAVVPLVALRWTGLAAGIGLAPLLLVLYAETGVPITVHVALLLGGAIAWQRDRPGGAALTAAGLLVVAPVILLPWRRLEVYGTIQADFVYGSDGRRLATLGLYVVAAGLVVLVADLARRSAAHRIALTAREGQVTRDAAVLDERARLARDLHDVVAHHVSLIAVRAETAPYAVEDLGAGGRQVLADIAGDARRALDELRGVLGVLRRASEDPARAPQPSAADIPSLVERAAASGEQVRWTHEPDGLDTIPPAVGYAGYRVVQEALTNARRHAPGRPVEVTCRPGGRGMWLRVVTDVGRPLGSPTPGRGLTGARERVEALEGRFAAGPVADSFVVEAEIPAGARG
ncbi:histidine kinase [Nocardioides sp.]|uniref:sensor histidine kinase n=1 Tax=Nocardioides sp. TaxID=35761 RepID=UPI002635D946|nr:histidine kinase [Nocardioides sp.]